MMRRPSTLIATSLLVLLAGCGATAEEGPATASSAPDATVRVAATAELTEGLTGAATRASGSRGPRELSAGGALDASEPPTGPGRRDGVGAGDTCVDTELTPSAQALARLQASTLCLLNGKRADRGLPPLTVNERLSRAARGHAADMVARSYFAHEGADGSDIRDRIGRTGYLPSGKRWVIGENLAWGTGALATPKAIVNAWMNSAGHRANVLHREYREIGFGIVLGNPKAGNGFGATYANAFGAVGDGPGDSGDGRSVTESAAAAPRRTSSVAKRRAAARRRVARRARAARQAKAARQARASRSARAARASTREPSAAG